MAWRKGKEDAKKFGDQIIDAGDTMMENALLKGQLQQRTATGIERYQKCCIWHFSSRERRRGEEEEEVNYVATLISPVLRWKER